ncbi:TraM recognition domain-containing protein [Bdellovibrionota bacterium FG-2]
MKAMHSFKIDQVWSKAGIRRMTAPIMYLGLVALLCLISSIAAFAFDPFAVLNTAANAAATPAVAAVSKWAIIIGTMCLFLIGVIYGRILAGAVESEGDRLERATRVGFCLLFLIGAIGLAVGLPIYGGAEHSGSYSGLLSLEMAREVLAGIRTMPLFREATLNGLQLQVYCLIPLSIVFAVASVAYSSFKKEHSSPIASFVASGIAWITRSYVNLIAYWPLRAAYKSFYLKLTSLALVVALICIAIVDDYGNRHSYASLPILITFHTWTVFLAVIAGNASRWAVLALDKFWPTAQIIEGVRKTFAAVGTYRVNRSVRRQPDVIPLGRVISSKLIKSEAFITEQNLGYNIQMLGGSGTGKSNLIQLLLQNRIERGSGVIFVDLKADFETVDWLTKTTAHYRRAGDLQIFSLTDRGISTPYNPLESGTVNEIHSRIMNSFKWTEEYYRKTASAALSDVLLGLDELKQNAGEHFTLEHVHAALSKPEILEAWAIRPELSQYVKSALLARAQRLKTKEGSQEVSGIVTDLQLLIRSSAGGLLTSDASVQRGINFEKAIKERKIVYFLMNSMQDKESSVALGKILLQDLISTVGRIYKGTAKESRNPVALIVDEFASFATENFIDLLNRSRGAGMGVVIAHQSRGDLEAVSDTFSDQVERNCNTKVIYGTDNPEDAEYYAAMVGTKKTQKETRQVQQGVLLESYTGMKSVHDVDEFVIHPNEIKKLGQGQALLMKRVVNQGRGSELVDLYRADAAPELSGQTVVEMLSAARAELLKETRHRMVSLDGPPPSAVLKAPLRPNQPGVRPQGDESFL